VFSILIAAGYKVAAVTAVRPEEAMSINTPEQLSRARSIMQARLAKNARSKVKN
jgi:bifunctional N-acetylglucosamine-1-phosphate-uridyltransferase/glucosamine-1-phosphate-acetyltransferase GlmU-like protein